MVQEIAGLLQMAQHPCSPFEHSPSLPRMACVLETRSSLIMERLASGMLSNQIFIYFYILIHFDVVSPPFLITTFETSSTLILRLARTSHAVQRVLSPLIHLSSTKISSSTNRLPLRVFKSSFHHLLETPLDCIFSNSCLVVPSHPPSIRTTSSPVLPPTPRTRHRPVSG